MKKILFIEDEAALQKTFGEILKQEGYSVVPALNGEIGLRQARNETPDLILLDLVLPGLHGLEVLKKIKEDDVIKNVPVVVLTNLEGTEDIEKAIELGATTYLVKANYSIQELVNKIKSVLGD